MNKLTLVMVAVLVTVAMMSSALVVMTIQEADARTSVKQKVSNKCKAGAFCQAQGIISIPGSGTSGTSVKQKVVNECSGASTTCLAGGQITIGGLSRPGGGPDRN